MANKPIDNNSADRSWTNFDKVFQRAKQLHREHAAEFLKSKILAGDLHAQAKTIKKYVSDECYEFPNGAGFRLDHKSDEYQERESQAYEWGRNKLRVPSDGSVHVLTGEGTIFVWIGVHLDDELEDARISFRGDLEMLFLPTENSLTIHSYDPRNGLRRWPGSRYRSETSYQRLEASGVRFLQSSVDAILPYSTDYPTREKQGRRQKFPIDESLEFLRKAYRDVDLPATMVAAQAKLYEFWASEKDRISKKDGISKTTCENHVRAFYRERRPSS